MVGSHELRKSGGIGPSGDRAIGPSKTKMVEKSIVAGRHPALREANGARLGRRWMDLCPMIFSAECEMVSVM